MKIAIPLEIDPNEKRVAATPETVGKMVKAGEEVWVQSKAGLASGFLDEEYQKAGAKLASNASSLYKKGGIVLKVKAPFYGQKNQPNEINLIPEEAILISLISPFTNIELVENLRKRKITTLALDMVPRIARAQKLDVLSSQSNVTGYKAVLLAANTFQKMMPMMMTAAGTILPAKVFVIGAGVAGLQAIATAKRLGALVEAFDTRPIVKDQVESLGAKFISIEVGEKQTETKGGYAKALSKKAHQKEQDLLAKQIQEADIVITTALIPGKPAPELITKKMVEQMRPGSVIVDLAAEAGGNCALTKFGENFIHNGVHIIGPLNPPSLMANQSSQMLARNFVNLLFEILKEGKINLDLEDEIIQGVLITRNGKIIHPDVQKLVQGKK